MRLGIAVGLLLALGLGGAPSAAEDAPDLEELKRAIAEREVQLLAYERQEQGLFDAIEAVDRTARALRADAARATAEAASALQEERRLTSEASDLAAAMAATQATLARRAVALYKAGEVGALRWVFSEGSLADRVARVQAVQMLVDHDDLLLRRYGRERAELETAQAGARAAAAELQAARERLEERSAQLEQERRGKRELLVRVRQDRARERALLNELTAAARELESTLDEIRRDSGPPTASGFASLRGRLDPPVAGGISRAFGRVIDAEYRTQTFRKGVDFQVELGDPVYAVAAGTVRFADWFRGYGRMVIMDHGGDHFTVSGHLDEIAVSVGASVAAGDPIGAAGETGSLTGPILYFEIRQGPEALDPAAWLRLPPPL